MRLNICETKDDNAFSSENDVPIGGSYTCPICGKKHNFSFYHILPEAFFESSRGIVVCSECHKLLKLINRHIQQEIWRNCHEDLSVAINDFFFSEDYIHGMRYSLTDSPGNREKIMGFIDLNDKFQIKLNPYQAIHFHRKKQSWTTTDEEGREVKPKKAKVCAKCGVIYRLGRHHIKDVEIYGANNHYATLCRNCHEDVEELKKEVRKFIIRECACIFIEIYKIFLIEKISFNSRKNIWIEIERRGDKYVCKIK